MIYKYFPSINGIFESTADFNASMLSSTRAFTDLLDILMDKLNYTEDEKYKQSLELFKTYTGTDVAYDPYYNHENLAHPSY